MNGSEVIARSSIQIGKNCLIGSRCTLMDSDFHGMHPSARLQPGITMPIVIEDNVWLGSEVMVLKGVRIGADAVVGARTVVSKDVPAGAVVVGASMRIVGSVYADAQARH